MCSIYGAVGRFIDYNLFDAIREKAKDRGRDGGRFDTFELSGSRRALLGNWRATPTPELEIGPLQPYDGMVHNGTIANDKELGARPGEIDSQVLARVVERHNIHTLAMSLFDVKGSYALALVNAHTVLAAVNYKPLHYATIDETVYFSSMARHFDGLLPHGHAPVAVPPYTVMDLSTGDNCVLRRLKSKRAVVIASAGLDSTVAATKLVREGWTICLLHFDYGCLAGREEHDRIPRIAEALGCHYQILQVNLKQMLGRMSSSLFDGGPAISGAIEGAEYAHEWVPGRNLVFISLAVAWAEAHGYHAVALGNNLEESGAYPDNEEQFTTLLNQAAPYAVQAHWAMEVLAPVGNLMKHEIVKLGLELDAPFKQTWSCYTSGTRHCGECGPCFMRKKAFERSGGKDPVFG